MDLINQTGIPAELAVSDAGEDAPSERRRRRGSIVAKCTFLVDEVGRTAVDCDQPLELFREAQPTQHGLLPRDLIQDRHWTGTEVVCCAAAYSSGQTQVTVSLTVGDATESLRVFGDRLASTSAIEHEPVAQPFTRMPILWSRAYGGTLDVEMDEHTRIPFPCPENLHGRGYLPDLAGRDLRVAGFATGYPRLPENIYLPNVLRADDAPEVPISWEAMPVDLGVAYREDHSPKDGPFVARPPWRLPQVMGGTEVRLSGCRPAGHPWAFRFPGLRLEADYRLGVRTGSFRLRPELLVLLPEESKFTVTYRYSFRYLLEDGVERSIRMRAEG